MSHNMTRDDIAYHQTGKEEGLEIPLEPPQRTPCQKCALSSCLLGFVFLTAGIIGSMVLKPYINNKIVENMVFEEDGLMFLGWKDPPVTPLMSIYFFNLTNEKAFLSGKEKAKVNKIGPYVWSQEIHKVNTVFGEDGDTITYSDNKTYMFARGLSVGDESDLIVMPNIPLFGAFRKLEDAGSSMKNGFEQVIGSYDFVSDTVPFLKMSVKEFLWGYPSILMTLNYAESEECQKEQDEDVWDNNWESNDDFYEDYEEYVVDECSISEATLKPFGFFMGMNGTVQGARTLLTGKNDIKNKGLYKYAYGKDHLGSWSEDRCNVVQGRDPGCLTIDVDKNEMMNLYFQNMCRNIKFRYMSTVQHVGVEAFRFSAVEETFNSPGDNSENSCYCHDSQKCVPSGVFDLGIGCKPLSPVYMSWPHFLYGNPDLRENVLGIDSPNQTTHAFYLDIQPDWGITLAARARFQMNVIVEKNGFSWFDQIEEPVVLPFLYIDEGIEGPNAIVEANVNMLLNIADKVEKASVIVGIVGILVGFVFMIPNIVFRMKLCCNKKSLNSQT